MTNGNSFTRLVAAQALWRISGNASKALPVLLEPVSPKEQEHEGPLLFAIDAIGDMGPAANAAIPDLQRVRSNSTRAIQPVDRALTRIRAPQQPPEQQ